MSPDTRKDIRNVVTGAAAIGLLVLTLVLSVLALEGLATLFNTSPERIATVIFFTLVGIVGGFGVLWWIGAAIHNDDRLTMASSPGEPDVPYEGDEVQP